MRREALLLCGACLVALAGCADSRLARESRTDRAPVVDRGAAASTRLSSHVEMLQKLLQSPPAEQAELVVAAQREYELEPTAAHQLRFALALGTPGHGASDLPRAQRMLQELLAMPQPLSTAEMAYAYVQLTEIERNLSLTSENQRLQDSLTRGERERTAAMGKRLQTEIDENTRLRKELEDARAKLDAIANIERSMNERKPSPEARAQ